MSHLKPSDTNRKVYAPQIIEALPRIFDLRHSVKERKFSLLELLIEIAHSQATNLRDQVFALLGIANDAAALGIEIDYAAGSSRVFLVTAERHIETTHRLDVLCVAQRTTQHEVSGLPSWVPDFTIRPARVVLGYPRSRSDQPTEDSIYDRAKHGYLASGNEEFKGTFQELANGGCALKAEASFSARSHLSASLTAATLIPISGNHSLATSFGRRCSGSCAAAQI